MDSPENVSVFIYSITGALVASFYNNTIEGENLLVICKEQRNGGLDMFSFTVPSNSTEPLFNDMECQINVDGVHWFSGYAEYIPERDTDEPIIKIEGKGFVHKLKEKVVDEEYTSQTLDYIIKDLADTYLGSDINVYYDVAKISVPVISAITIEFKDKTLFECFELLNGIANKDYETAPYTWGVDEEKELYYSAIPTTEQSHIFEGYHYQKPKVNKVSSKIINKILTYRTTIADSSVTEYVATYEDVNSQELYGLFETKITFPDFVDTTTIANIANGILEKNADPFYVMEIEDLPVRDKKNIGFYAMSNRRDKYFLSVNELEDLTEWDTTQMLNTTPTIDSTEVFTGRKALKLVCTSSSSGDYMEHTLSEPIQFPDLFRMFVLLGSSTSNITVRLYDSSNNIVDLKFGESGDLSGEWIKRLTEVSIILDTGFLEVDYDVSNSGFMIVDYDVSNSGQVIVDTLVREAVGDISKVRITINSNTSNTVYIDAMSVEANTYLYRKLLVEEISYQLGKSVLAFLTLGGKVDSLIDGIKDNVSDGNIALSIFSKQ